MIGHSVHTGINCLRSWFYSHARRHLAAKELQNIHDWKFYLYIFDECGSYLVSEFPNGFGGHCWNKYPAPFPTKRILHL